MTKRSLSKRESDLVLALEWDRRQLVSLGEIRKRLRCSSEYARYVAHILIKKGWLASIARGQYQLINANRGPMGVPEMNPYLAVRTFKKPYFFAYRFACTHHGLSTQVPSVIHVSVTSFKKPMELKNVRFEFVVLTKKRFFGFQEMTAFGEKINISDLERTVLDALDRPELVGGIETAARAVFKAGKKMDYVKLLDYFKRMDDSALTRRFGYLAALLKIKLPSDLLNYLKTQIKKDPAFLGSPKRWGKNGEHDPAWNLIINVGQDELMGEIKIV